MIYSIYSVRDELVGYMQPFTERNDSCAERGFTKAISDGDSVLASHKSDFVLYRIGSFDDSTGLIDALEVPELICRGDSIV